MFLSKKLPIFFALSLIYFSTNCVTEASRSEDKLISDLLDKLNLLERPVENYHDVLNVSVGLTLMSIINVDIDKETIDLNIWESLEWNDYKLRWSRENYDNISSLRIPSHRIWSPDIYISNHGHDSLDPFFKTLSVVNYNGTVSSILPGETTTTCKMDLKKYPFEKLECEIKLLSWTYDGSLLDLIINGEEGDISSFRRHPEWEVHGFHARKTTLSYACCPEPYVDVAFTLMIQRRGDQILASARVMNSVIYGFLILSMMLMPNSGLRILFALLAMLLSSYCSLQFNPRCGKYEPPEIVLYYNIVFLISFLVLITNVIVYNLFNKIGQTPSWITKSLARVPPWISPDRVDDESKMNELIGDLGNREGGVVKRMSDWQYLSMLVDKVVFALWVVILVIFHFIAFPTF
ncbi:neuronal acetylcholine receptor subunit alpha-9-like [Folsomia candida]|uniref:neuronal acetylcholine receptor subunit alpha-9-like n=1 Tax=Folsomia candida TaxID=158441 RepID=UPI001604DAB4|nr:neuronal acetylcholine receptor subunit alpha-9-like [Folsomia candida]